MVWRRFVAELEHQLAQACGMPLSIFAMIDSVMTRPSAVRCGKPRPRDNGGAGRLAAIADAANLC
jgi:hypothetical protein